MDTPQQTLWWRSSPTKGWSCLPCSSSYCAHMLSQQFSWTACLNINAFWLCLMAFTSYKIKPNGHSLFQWMQRCPEGYLGHNLPPKARLSLETVDTTDDAHPCGLILSFTVLGTCLPSGMHNRAVALVPSPCVPWGHFSHPNHRLADGVASNPHMDEKLLTLHKGQLATEYTWI